MGVSATYAENHTTSEVYLDLLIILTSEINADTKKNYKAVWETLPKTSFNQACRFEVLDPDQNTTKQMIQSDISTELRKHVRKHQDLHRNGSVGWKVAQMYKSLRCRVPKNREEPEENQSTYATAVAQLPTINPTSQ